MHVFLPFNLTRDQPMSFFRIVRHAHWTVGSMHLQWLFETNAPSLLRLIESTGATVIVPIGVDLSMVEARLLDHEADGPAKIAAWRDHLLNSGDPQTKPLREQLYWTLSHADVPNWHPSVNGSERDVDLVLGHAPGWWKDPARELHEKNVWRWLTGVDKERIARELEVALSQSRMAEPRWWDMEHDDSPTSPFMFATSDQACAVTAKAKDWTAVPWARDAHLVAGSPYLDATLVGAVDVVAAHLNALVVPDKTQPRRITLRGALNVANLVKSSAGLTVGASFTKVMGREMVVFTEDNGFADPDQVITLEADGQSSVEVYTSVFVTLTTPRTFTFLNVTPI